MNITIDPKTEAANLMASLGIAASISQPSAQVDGKWPCIAYTATFSQGTLPPLATPYRLGIGHVNLAKFNLNASRDTFGMSVNMLSMARCWKANPSANFLDKDLQAQVAAHIARVQKVQPNAGEVLACICRDALEATESTFEEWASNLGYEEDSRKAESIYNACRQPYASLLRLCGGADNMRKLAEIQF